ncbi:MAG: SDR family NAD(P)-dependent oxidoreductase, partial [Bacteroidetes bacterium]
MRLSDKVALITGASAGIGRETALRFAQEGARIVAVDIHDKEGLATVEA